MNAHTEYVSGNTVIQWVLLQLWPHSNANNTTYNKYSTRSTSNIHYTTRCGVMGLSPYYKHYKHYKHY